jgi:hypothetical protein
MKEPTAVKMRAVLTLAKKVSKNWVDRSQCGYQLLAHQVAPLKKQVHPRLEYNVIHDPTCESNHHLKTTKLSRLHGEIFYSTNDWLTLDQVSTFHIQMIRHVVSQFN